MKTKSIYLITGIVLLLALGRSIASPVTDNDDELKNKRLLRSPIAILLSHDQQKLIVANEKAGSISLLDIKEKSTLSEIRVGKQLHDLVRVGDTNSLLAADFLGHEIIWLNESKKQIEIRKRFKTAKYPTRIAINNEKNLAAVSSIWSRQVTFFELDANAETAKRSGTLDFEFAPREIVFTKDGAKLIVADNFGNQLGFVNVKDRKLEFTREFPGHNLRGIGVSPDGKMFVGSHQMLNELAHTVRNDVHWGLLMSNDLRWIQVDQLVNPKGNIYKNGQVHPLGTEGAAAGDPGDLEISDSGLIVVTLSGIDEIAVGSKDDFRLKQVKVGDRPVAAAIDKENKFAYVANAFDDSVSIVDLKQSKQVGVISYGNQPELNLAQRGERLFFDANLSHDSWLSCQSCHTDGHTNGMLNDNLSDNSFGAPKRVLSLLGRADTQPLAWNGSIKTFEAQIKKSLKNTMQMDEEPTQKQIEAIAAFVKELKSPPPLDEARDRIDKKIVTRGRDLFMNKLECKNCHAPPSYTTSGVYDVGLKDQMDNSKFNPPSLRGVSQRMNFFHDNRAKSLESVFSKFKHQLPTDVSERDVQDLLAFLRSI